MFNQFMRERCIGIRRIFVREVFGYRTEEVREADDAGVTTNNAFYSYEDIGDKWTTIYETAEEWRNGHE